MSNILELLYAQQDDTCITLPSGIAATIREMTGHDQKVLTNRGTAINGQSINHVLASCVLSLNDTSIKDLKAIEAEKVVSGLLSADRQALMFHIRRISLGDEFKFKSKCPNCDQQGEWEVVLSEQDFPCKPYAFQKNEDGTDNKKHIIWDSKVRPGLKFRAAFITGEEELKAMRNKTKVHGLSDLEMRELRVWEPEKETWLLVDPNKLADKIIAEIRETMKEAEGQQDDEVSITCTGCGQEAKFNLLQLPDFMIPSVLS